ncbi:hypothetical protein EGT49_07720 [Companilactobacillus suantsaicola]|uniref:Mga helix-turn-helix domain-containing protein n=1 Tax=Companilactobacillus suantsaicola TaxID=2487723 RepID=A0A4Z0JIV1_9LACO|nr:helix-turn-helix domain-containing protein [Companilactobacillus suantsaicola]TGD22805.1 hypothetical protein EGT49_07720 [Companilactobacillus suantsaicola]
MLEQIFLVKQDVEKYRMLTVIKSLPPREVNLSNISSRLQFTYQKTYNIFQALLEDFVEVAPDIDSSDTKIESIDFSKISIDTYRLYLVKNSVVFQAFNYGLTSANPSFESFSNDHFTSKSTLNRRMSKFRAFLKNFGLKISNSTLEIKGNEKNYTDLYKDVYTFFSNVDQNEFPGIYNAAELISKDLYQVLPSYISTIRQEDIIKVKVLIDPGNQAAEVVLRNIRTLGFVEVVPSDVFDDVDVLITSLDVLPLDIEKKKYPENLKVISWDISSTRPDYIWLLIQLNQIYVKKLKEKKIVIKRRRHFSFFV